MSTVRRTTARACLRVCAPVLVLTALVLAATATGASALIVQLPNGKTVSIQPRRGHLPSGLGASGLNSTANLIYHGGPVMSSNSNYAFYWAPSGSPAYPAEYQSGVNQFLEDLAHDSGGEQNVDSVAVQYTDGSGHAANYDSHFAGAIIDTDPYPANGCKKAPICLTDAQLQAELSKYIIAHELPRDLAHEYFMLTPPKVEDCFEANGLECSAGTTAGVYCAYHGSFTSGAGVIVYANDPYVTGIEGCDTGEHPNNKPSDGVIEGGLSHEHNESITDPELNAWYGSNGEENGDKCRTFVESSEYGTPLGHRARRLALQPADQRPRVLVPAGVEQRRQRLQAASGAGPAGRLQTRARQRPRRRRNAGRKSQAPASPARPACASAPRKPPSRSARRRKSWPRPPRARSARST